MKLGVNIDHIALLRESRKINDPDPLDAVPLARLAGADQITIHLREDRRHINDDDAKKIIQNSQLPVNLECSIDPDIIEIVAKLKPHRATIVPEKREEVTTEGGLDIASYHDRLDSVVHFLKANDIEVSLFIDPTIEMVRASKVLLVDWVELHTGAYANIHSMLYSNLRYTHNTIKELDIQRRELEKMLKKSLNDIALAAKEAEEFGIKVAAGHGLNYQNVKDVASIEHIEELNIGQCIIARSVFTGFQKAVEDMIELIK
ncbi:MAG: pyridoxine 5'-phosphate synthase [Epsilonproteobacteria bacterium]|nr:pyridoxine 5'-phosphate synthase [Campylobacterota bacterium]